MGEIYKKRNFYPEAIKTYETLLALFPIYPEAPLIQKEIEPPLLYGHQSPEVVLCGWGSTYGPMKEAVDILKEKYWIEIRRVRREVIRRLNSEGGNRTICSR